MESIPVLLLIGGIFGVQMFRLWRQRRAEQKRPPVPAESLEGELILPASVQPEASLAPELHGLENVFAPFGQSTAHPRELAEHPAFEKAVALLAEPGVSLGTVMQYALGANWALSCAGLAALARREDRNDAVDQVLAHFDRLAPWAMYFALDYFCRIEPRPPTGAAVATAKDWWHDNPFLPLMFRDYFAQRESLGDTALFGAALHSPAASPAGAIRGFLNRVNHPFAAALIAQLDEVQRHSVNRDFLTSFGRFWTEPPALDILIEPKEWHHQLLLAQATLRQAPVRSLLVSGERLVGKTSLLLLLARRLAREGWAVFEASGADLMAGQQWFGQLEGRIQQTIDEVGAAKKLIWYIPDLLQLAHSGTHQGQAASMLDQILPAILSGRIIIWTEMGPTASTRLLQMRPLLRALLEILDLQPLAEPATTSLLQAISARLSSDAGVLIAGGCAASAVSLGRQYLSSSTFPGSAIQLLKLTVSRVGIERADIGPDDILQTLSQLTGLPKSILDNNERIDLAAIRAFFSARVIGQDEAVAAIVSRIAMLKSGLNDPDRPIGVFLFAGPTGTGKTELAKTTAEYLFGSDERLIRLDMSEFQTPDATANIVGSGAYGEVDSLISRVRKQPFSVVLLDEFEKANPRIWDLFLQVFDDGRLTTPTGRSLISATA
ncbi:MAG: AAA family ATPase [Xanthobacteraceae bacterium]